MCGSVGRTLRVLSSSVFQRFWIFITAICFQRSSRFPAHGPILPDIEARSFRCSKKTISIEVSYRPRADRQLAGSHPGGAFSDSVNILIRDCLRAFASAALGRNLRCTIANNQRICNQKNAGNPYKNQFDTYCSFRASPSTPVTLSGALPNCSLHVSDGRGVEGPRQCLPGYADSGSSPISLYLRLRHCLVKRFKAP